MGGLSNTSAATTATTACAWRSRCAAITNATTIAAACGCASYAVSDDACACDTVSDYAKNTVSDIPTHTATYDTKADITTANASSYSTTNDACSDDAIANELLDELSTCATGTTKFECAKTKYDCCESSTISRKSIC